MLEWTIGALRLCRAIGELCRQALEAQAADNQAALVIAQGQLRRSVADLERMTPGDFPPSRLADLRRHAGYGQAGDLTDILRNDLPDVEAKIEAYAQAFVPAPGQTGFHALLHPAIWRVAERHYHAGDYRNAVLDAVVAVFDEIRRRTGLDLDGDRLISRALSTQDPYLVLSELNTDSGRNDQSGFMEIYRGFYRGVRNPKAHSLIHDLDQDKAGQYLVLASLLMRRVVEAAVMQAADPASSAAT